MPSIDLPLERAVSAASSGIVIADATREGFPLSYVNAAFLRLTGYREEDCIGRNCRFLQGPETDPAAIAAISAALADGRESTSVLLNYRADGTTFYNELRLATVRDGDGRVTQVIGVQNDVTETIAELSELRSLRDSLGPVAAADRPGLDLAAAFVPAEQGVAGDFHLMAPGPGDTTVAVVGDVMGHGPPAARRASYVRTALSTFAAFTDDPLRLLEMANHSLIERVGTSAEFVTAVCASYDPGRRRLRWALAGHPPPVALGSGDSLASEARPSLPLGIGIDLDGDAAEVQLAPGDGVLLFTDGLSEARTAHGGQHRTAMLGDARMRDLIRKQGAAAPRAIVDALARAVGEHTSDHPADDLCVVALRATGP